MCRRAAQEGFVLPVVVTSIVVVAIIAGAVFNYVLYGTRVAGVHATASQCRLAAQTALDQSKVDIRQVFKNYYRANPSTWDVLSWFDSFSVQTIGMGGYVCSLMQNGNVNGHTVTVTVQGIERAPSADVFQYARVTLQATASGVSPSGISISKTIEETVEYALRRSSVFDYAYFVNNYGWFQGSGCTANGNIRANGNMELDSLSYINGVAYAAPNAELGAAGNINVIGGGTTRFMSRNEYWSNSGLSARPTSPAADGAGAWAMGYEAKSGLYAQQETLEMPFLGDLDGYRTVANNLGGTIKQNGKTLVSGCYSGVGPSGLAGGADKGSLVLDGTSKPIEISGPVVIDGDVIIKGTVKGQGAIYAGRNIHIVGDVTYSDAPTWPKPDTKTDQTVKSNAGKDILGLVAKGNIVLGNYTASDWLTSIKSYITPPFVKPYACDVTDSAIGYPSTFAGDYTALDSGRTVTYTYNSKTKKYEPSGTAARKYYESSVGAQKVIENAQATAITRIDAVLYNNHGIMGKVGQCLFNGALVGRDEGIRYATAVKFNWDIRLGSRSPDGINFFIYLPMSVADPRVVGWREVL
jgi:hypothetical protein